MLTCTTSLDSWYTAISEHRFFSHQMYMLRNRDKTVARHNIIFKDVVNTAGLHPLENLFSALEHVHFSVKKDRFELLLYSLTNSNIQRIRLVVIYDAS